MGTGMPMPAFACPLAKNLIPAIPEPEDLPKMQMPICMWLQKFQKYRALTLVKTHAHAQKFINGQMLDVPMPANFE